MIKEYVWLGDMPLAQIGGTVSTPTYAYVHTGQIGEPLMVTDASQAKVWDVVNDPWGNALPLSTASLTQDLRFPGQSTQAETGLFQNWHRDYDPSLGRYIEADPIGLAGGSNLFAYANGSPLRFVDPSGLMGAVAALPFAGGAAASGGSILAFCVTPAGWVVCGLAAVGTVAYVGFKLSEWNCPPPLEMAKGGNQNKGNEYSRAAKANMPQDPCAYLRDLYEKTPAGPEREKIKTAQKVLSCRRNSTQR